jgi:DNA polymerase III epsilon subunit-like protein
MEKTLMQNFISVDIETAGPNPSDYPILSIGACLISNPDETFYIELIPTTSNVVPSALAVSGLSIETLQENGVPPKEAMQSFANWAETAVGNNGKPVFVAFNAVFDWMFVHDYFHRFIGYNPFGHSALDIKAFYMGFARVDWQDTKQILITKKLNIENQLSHHALQDAIDQAVIFTRLLDEIKMEKEL